MITNISIKEIHELIDAGTKCSPFDVIKADERVVIGFTIVGRLGRLEAEWTVDKSSVPDSRQEIELMVENAFCNFL